jgi:alkylhydroperoxidase family enzyme
MPDCAKRRKNAMPNDYYVASTQTMVDAALITPGDTTPELRRAIKEWATELSGLFIEKSGAVPTELTSYVRKVALHAYKVTDEDVEILRQAGYSEQAIFEITLSAALGAGLARLECGLRALEEEQL